MFGQVAPARLPMSQKMMMPTCSSARNLRKPMAADRMALTITPARIRLVELRLRSPLARKSTTARVATPPAKANTGTDTPTGSIRPKICRTITSEAPKAAPVLIPRV